MLKQIITKVAYNAAGPNPRKIAGYPLIFLLFFAPMILLVGINLYETYWNTTSLAIQRQQRDTLPSLQASNAELRKLSDMTLALSNHPLVKEYSSKKEWKKMEEVMGIFLKITNSPEIDRIFMSDANGVLQANSKSGPTAVIGENFSEKQWFTGVTSTGKLFVSDIYSRKVDNKFIFTIAAPVVNDAQTNTGIIALQIKLDAFQDDLSQSKLPEGAVSYVVDRNGKVLNPADSGFGALDAAGLPQVNNVRRGESGWIVSDRSYIGGQVLATYEPIKEFGWGVVIERPYEQAFSVRQKNMLKNFSFQLAIIIFYSILVRPIVQAITEHKNSAS